MEICKPGLYEYQIEAELVHQFMRKGSRAPAYPSIVGGGANACILHYDRNDAEVKDGDLILIDAGCEYKYYASDITRTFPANGTFNPQQKAIYEIVLKAQDAAIEAVQPGAPWDAPHNASVKVITQGLIKLGLIEGTLAKAIKAEAYRDFYMHRVGHWIGIDVHDVSPPEAVFVEGMVVTVEMFGDEETFLLGSREITDDTMQVYSEKSPIGAAVNGSTVGDTVSYEAPNGKQVEVKVLATTPYTG